MSLIVESAFFRALGWALADSLWQMGSVWLLYTLFTSNGRRFSASVRHMLALLGVVTGILWTATAFIVYCYSGSNHGLFYFVPSWAFLRDIIPYLSLSYLLTVFFLLIRWTRQYHLSSRLRSAYRETPDNLAHILERLQKITGCRRKLRLWISDSITTPLTSGFLKPVILFPVAAINQLNTQQVEAIIAHELLHIRRHDYLIHVLTSLTGVLFFFNPFARLLLQIIRQERENACDDEVLQLGFDRLEYAQALYILGRNDAEDYRFALGATGHGGALLLQRIKRMTRKKETGPRLLKPAIILFFCSALSIVSIDQERPADTATLSPSPAPAIKVAQLPPVPVVQVNGQELSPNSAPIRQTVIIKEKSQKHPPEKVKISRLVYPADPEEIEVDEMEPVEDVFIASFISARQTEAFTFTPATTSEFQKPESVSPNEPFIPQSTFYFPTHEILGKENGKTTVEL